MSGMRASDAAQRVRAQSVLMLLVSVVLQVACVTWLASGHATAHPWLVFAAWFVLLFVVPPLVLTAGVAIGETDPDRVDGVDGGGRDA